MGRYRPPDSDPRRVRFNATDALASRARRLGTHAMLVVRFELPFHVICSTCSAHHVQGTRFNAEKRPTDWYLSTRIWTFTCKCSCSAKFDILTDPQNAQYTLGTGARRQHQEWHPEQSAGHAVYDSDKQHDAFAKIERDSTQQRRIKENHERIIQLERAQLCSKDPYTSNAALRATLREQKTQAVRQMQTDQQIKRRIAWNDHLHLSRTSSTQSEKDRSAWIHARSNCRVSPTTSTQTVHKLKAHILANTLRKRDPFLSNTTRTSPPLTQSLVKPRSSTRSSSITASKPSKRM